MSVEKTCIVCSNKFKVSPSVSRKGKGIFCSRICRGKKEQKQILKNCIICNKEFYIRQYRKDSAKSCSEKCSMIYVNKLPQKNFWRDATEQEKLEKLKELFNIHVIRKDGCWDWNNRLKDIDGYGLIGVNQKTLKAHRVSWLIHKGEITTGLLVCHKCDNPPCTNPEHLFLGTHQDNAKDCAKKGRTHKPSTRNLETAKEIKELLLKNSNLTNSELSRQFKINRQIIYKIRHSLKPYNNIK